MWRYVVPAIYSSIKDLVWSRSMSCKEYLTSIKFIQCAHKMAYLDNLNRGGEVPLKPPFDLTQIYLSGLQG